MRFMFLCAVIAASGVISAQVTYFAGTAPGYAVTQFDVPPPGAGSFSLPGGAVWDPAGPDFYYYDSDAEAIRRFDMTAGAPAAAALFDVPNPVFGPYVDSMAFDLFVTTDLYAIESGAQVIHKLRRNGPDTLDPTFGTGGALTSASYGFYPYDLEMDAFGRLFVIGSDGSTQTSGVFLVDKSTLAVTQVVDIYGPAGSNFSGPIAFDSEGNLHIGLPPATFNPTDPMRIVRFAKSRLDSAVNSSGAIVLGMADGTLVVDASDGFPTAGSMAFRAEGGADVLYFAGTHTGEVYRSVLATRAYAVFAFGGMIPSGTVFFPSALVVESQSAPFRPYSGDTTRMLVSMVHRDATFAVLGHGLCVMGCESAPSGVATLEVTDGSAAVANGTPFRFQVELRDAGGAPLGVNASIAVEILSGSGTLSGTTYRIASNGVAIFDDLVLTGGENSLILHFSLVGGTATVNSGTISVSKSGTADSTSSSDGGTGCTSGTGTGSAALLALVAALGVARRLPFGGARVANR